VNVPYIESVFSFLLIAIGLGAFVATMHKMASLDLQTAQIAGAAV
jgi:hypothetical protein